MDGLENVTFAILKHRSKNPAYGGKEYLGWELGAEAAPVRDGRLVLWGSALLGLQPGPAGAYLWH